MLLEHRQGFDGDACGSRARAFFGRVPFPLVHVDSTYKIPSMIEYRDRLVKDWKLELIV